MNTTNDIDFAKLIERVALRLLGHPNKGLSTTRELRFGKKGSMSVELDGSGVWSDFEAKTGGGTLDLVVYKTDCRTRGEAAAWIKREILRMKDDKPSETVSRTLVAEYEYYDEYGERRYRVSRWSDKTFEQHRWDEKTGKWIGGKGCLDGVERFPFMLHEILKADPNEPIFTCEGEKDVLNLATKCRVVATCNSEGAGKWVLELSRHFQDRDVVSLSDNDEAGRAHTRDVAQKLKGFAKRVRILNLPGLAEKEDVSDWLEAGGTREELFRLVETEAIDAEDYDFGKLPPLWETDHHNGIIANSQANIRAALADLEVTLSYNVFAERLLIRGPGSLPQRTMGDAEVNALYLDIDEKYKFRPTVEFFRLVVENETRRNSFHPVRDYLDSLVWDGKPRINRWLIDFAGAEDNRYVRGVCRTTLIAAVRRIRQPGAKFDEMLTIIHRTQGTEKSSGLSTLAVKDEWFSDDLPLNAKSKEVIEQTHGKWIIEASELKGMRDRAAEHLKAFLSRQTDRARAAYGHFTTERPRQFIVIGTTNEEKFLRDTTGNRRFWPIEIKGFNTEALRRGRDQLWAEAAHYEAKGESIRLPVALWGLAEVAQNERMIVEPWVELLCEKLMDDNGDPMMGKIRSEDVWAILGVPTERRTQDNNNKLGQAMRLNGWEAKQLRFGGKRCSAYVRGKEHQQQERIIDVYVSDNGKHVKAQYQDQYKRPERDDEPKMPPIRERD